MYHPHKVLESFAPIACNEQTTLISIYYIY